MKKSLWILIGIVALAGFSARAQAPDDAQALQALMKAMSAGGTNAVTDFRALKALLPEEVAGMKRANASGEKNSAMGITVAYAEGTYQDAQEGRITIKISDMGGMGAMGAFSAMAFGADIDRESDEEYERTFDFQGHRGLEQYNQQTRSGKTQTMVASRYMVEIDGYQVAPESIRKALEAIDLAKLAALKPQ